MVEPETGDSSLLDARLRVPEQVVYRDFGDETVVLNLESGAYHGLNPTAALMVSRLDESPSVQAAIARLVEETGQPHPVIQRDVLALCASLAQRGLMERDDSSDGSH